MPKAGNPGPSIIPTCLSSISKNSNCSQRMSSECAPLTCSAKVRGVPPKSSSLKSVHIWRQILKPRGCMSDNGMYFGVFITYLNQQKKMQLFSQNLVLTYTYSFIAISLNVRCLKSAVLTSANRLL